MDYRSKLLLFVFVLSFSALDAQDRYVVYFTDKDNNSYSLDAPEEFLSERSLQRRSKQGIVLTEADLPVTESYLQALRDLGIKPYYASKWLNAALIQVYSEDLAAVNALDFVASVELVAEKPQLPSGGRIAGKNGSTTTADQNNIAYQWHGIDRIHLNRNYGNSMRIAVMDANFYNVNSLPEFAHLFQNDQIIMTENLVMGTKDVFQGPYDHGTRVLSILAAIKEGEFEGIATESEYLLFQTEDAPTENRIEEFNWTVAAEKADSAGADVINSSLGYSYGYSVSSMNYTYEDMDGETTMISKAAKRAIETGMMVVTSAGNEGNSGWKYITAPGDVENALTVGAINSDSVRAGFSSLGPTFDGRTKPDVVSLGVVTPQINYLGQVVAANGTSFSSPVMAGFTAILWQEYPDLTNLELLDLIRNSGHLASTPSNEYGFGIPNIQIVLGQEPLWSDEFRVFPVPARDILYWQGNEIFDEITIYNIQGKKMQVIPAPAGRSISVAALPEGIYVLTAVTGSSVRQIRFVKN